MNIAEMNSITSNYYNLLNSIDDILGVTRDRTINTIVKVINDDRKCILLFNEETNNITIKDSDGKYICSFKALIDSNDIDKRDFVISNLKFHNNIMYSYEIIGGSQYYIEGNTKYVYVASNIDWDSSSLELYKYMVDNSL